MFRGFTTSNDHHRAHNVEWNCFFDLSSVGISMKVYPCERDQFSDSLCAIHKGVSAYFPFAVVEERYLVCKPRMTGFSLKRINYVKD